MKRSIFLLAILTACSGSTGPDTPRTPFPAQLVGTWYSGDVSSTNYIVDNSWDNAYGNGLAFKFRSDGTFESDYEQYTNAEDGCAMEAFEYQAGTATIADSIITLYVSSGDASTTNTCGSNTDNPVPKKTLYLVYQFAPDNTGAVQLFLRELKQPGQWLEFAPFTR
jgi:hypothetical protein